MLWVLIMPDRLRLVAYYRKSDKDNGESIDQQRAWARPAAEEQKCELVREFADEGIPGHETAKRDAFHEMIAFCQEEKRQGRRIDGVVCWATSRFSREDSVDTNAFIHVLRIAGTSRMFTSAGRWIDFHNSQDLLVFNIQQDALNAQYVRDLSRDTVRGRLHKRVLRGLWAGGVPPIGYDVVNGKLTHGRPEAIELVRWIFATYLTPGVSLRAIAEDLNGRQVPSPAGKLWYPFTIGSTLKNPAYVGKLVWNRESSGKFFGVISCEVKPTSHKGANDPKNWIVTEKAHEPIVDVAVFEAAQIKLSLNRQRTARRDAHQFVLSGLVVCANCKSRMVGVVSKKKGKNKTYCYPRYFCSGYMWHGKSFCSAYSVDESKLTSRVCEKLRERYTGEGLDRLRAELRKAFAAVRTKAPANVAKLQREIARLDRALENGARKMYHETDEILATVFREEYDRHREQKNAKEAELAKLEAAIGPVRDVEADVEKAVRRWQNLEDAISRGNTAGVQEAMRQIVTSIELFFVTDGKRHHLARGVVLGHDGGVPFLKSCNLLRKTPDKTAQILATFTALDLAS